MSLLEIAYARKSTESDERQTQSITDQKNWIIDKLGNNPFSLFFESKSAKDPNQRVEFTKMIKIIEKTKCQVIIYCWKLDRLSRNPVDSGQIQYLMQKRKISKIITNDREYTAADAGLLMSVENAMSNQFILDMIKNVERGMKSKIEKGGCIQNVPLGYKNNKETKEADTDKLVAPYIKEIFQLRLEGESYNSIADNLYNKGLRGISGGRVSKSGVEGIIHNPFYIGLQKFQGKLKKSIHEKLVSVELWQEVNSVKRGYKKHDHTSEFPLKGIIKNYCTKKPLLALRKKKKYVYYCTHSREDIVINMNQKHVVMAFDAIIESYILPKEAKPFILGEIRKCLDIYHDNIKDKKVSFELSLSRNNTKTDNMFNLVCNGTISEEKYKSESNKIEITNERIKEELNQIQVLDRLIIEQTHEVVELLTNLDAVRKSADNDRKLLIIKLIVVELFVDTKKQLYVQENELFELVKVLYGFMWQGPQELHLGFSGSESEHSSN